MDQREWVQGQSDSQREERERASALPCDCGCVVRMAVSQGEGSGDAAAERIGERIGPAADWLGRATGQIEEEMILFHFSNLSYFPFSIQIQI